MTSPAFINQRGLAHLFLLFILLIGLGVGLYLISKPTIFKPKASQTGTAEEQRIKDLTEELVESTESVPKKDDFWSLLLKQFSAPGAPESSKDLEGVAQRRQEALIKAIQANPQILLNNQIPTEIRVQLPKEVQRFIEKKQLITGQLSIVHIDMFEEKKAPERYFLQTTGDEDTQRINQLHIVKDMPNLQDGSVVSVNALQIGNEIVVDTNKQVDLTVEEDPDKAKGVFGEQKLSIVKVKFKDDSWQSYSDEEIREALIGKGNKGLASVQDFLKEVSNNQVSLSLEFLGEVEVDSSLKVDYCNDYFFEQAANDELFRRGINVLDKTRLMYMLPNIPCSSNASIYATPSNARMIGVDAIDPFVLAHELGHNFGLGHANYFYCGDKPIDDFSKCKSEEYGDTSDVMGYRSHLAPFNAPHKLALGWMKKDQIQVIDRDGEYEITPLESNDGKIKILQLQKPDTNYNNMTTYNLSYRQPLGFSSTIGAEFTSGVNIHFVDDVPGRQTQLIYNSPTYSQGPPYSRQASLTDGSEYYDPLNDIKITQVSHDKDKVKVRVSFGDKAVFCPVVEFTNLPDPMYTDKDYRIRVKAQGGRNASYVTMNLDEVLVPVSSGQQDSPNQYSWNVKPAAQYDRIEILRYKVNDWQAYGIDPKDLPPARICGNSWVKVSTRYYADYTLSPRNIHEGQKGTLLITPNPELEQNSFNNIALRLDDTIRRLELDSSNPLRFKLDITGLESGSHTVQLVAGCTYLVENPQRSEDIVCEDGVITFNYDSFYISWNRNYANYRFLPGTIKEGEPFEVRVSPEYHPDFDDYNYVALLIDGKVKRLELSRVKPVEFKWNSRNIFDGENLSSGSHTFQLVGHCKYALDPKLKTEVPVDCSGSDARFSSYSLSINDSLVSPSPTATPSATITPIKQ